jgi:DNA-binding response OmpR family regulator
MAKKSKIRLKKVLVIDDERDLRRFSAWVLEAEGYLALQAADGESGLAIARQEHPDVILLDIKLPDRYGWTVLEDIKASPQLNDIPVVIFTASADVVYKSTAEKMKAADFLVKPVSAQALRECIRKIAPAE